jgi:hypothetical protein
MGAPRDRESGRGKALGGPVGRDLFSPGSLAHGRLRRYSGALGALRLSRPILWSEF